MDDAMGECKPWDLVDQTADKKAPGTKTSSKFTAYLQLYDECPVYPVAL